MQKKDIRLSNFYFLLIVENYALESEMSEFYCSKFRNYKNLSKYLFLGVPEKRKFYGERRSQAIAKGLGYSLSQPKTKLELRRKLLAEIFLFLSYTSLPSPKIVQNLGT